MKTSNYMNIWKYEYMNELINELMNEWMNEWKNEKSINFFKKIDFYIIYNGLYKIILIYINFK